MSFTKPGSEYFTLWYENENEGRNIIENKKSKISRYRISAILNLSGSSVLFGELYWSRLKVYEGNEFCLDTFLVFQLVSLVIFKFFNLNWHTCHIA